MQFYDEVSISIESWKWWDWIASWRRESWIPFWWPSWGDWGDWWSVFFVASKDENTLIDYKYKKNFKAKPWEPGRTKDQYWSHWENLNLIVPVGTMIKDKETWKLLAQLEEDQQKVEILKWWKWGFWNIHFKDSVNQYPNFYLLGEPWQKKEVTLELQLLADVWLIWSPSVWKSSLINCMADVKAKVADYPFTTLVPNLWSVSVGDFRFNVIDIPWIIEWASEGKWLWNAFLRHVLKAKVFAFVADLSRFESWIKETVELFWEIVSYLQEKFDDQEDLSFIFREEDWCIVFEVEKDDEILLEKKVVLVLNKRDLLNDEDILKEYKKALFEKLNNFLAEDGFWSLSNKILENNTFITSAWTYHGVWELLRKFAELLQKTKDNWYYPDTINEELENNIDDEENIPMVFEITDQEKEFLIEEWYIEELESRFAKIWYVQNPEICKMTFMIPRWNDQAEQYYWNQMQSKWFLDYLTSEWVMKWDILKIKSYYEWLDDKYILY